MVAPNHPDNFEDRLNQLREEALAKGAITGEGVRPAGGPIPAMPLPVENTSWPGYYGLPVLKEPVWKWMISLYFFVGGLAGMSGLVALGALLKHDWELARVAVWQAAIGALISPILLIWDLGRPMRFLNMLRVLKLQSPMSLGSWILSAFGAATIPALILTEWHLHNVAQGGSMAVVHGLAIAAIAGSALSGIFLATYTGALLGVTAVPAWHLHRAILPLKFGIAGLGSASGLLELLGFHRPELRVIGYGAAIAETFVMISLEVNKHGAADRALHQGGSGWTLRIGEALEGPLAILFRAFAGPLVAAGSFILGALLTRFGWLAAGRKSAKDPEAVFAGQRIPAATTPTHA
jgi:formate-dependent nitrite reductase membrane component NrfD